MDSSFLTLVNVVLGLFAATSLVKIFLRYGWPAHPARLTVYLVSFCAAIYFGMKALVGLGLVPPFAWMKWRTLPLVAGSLALLLQVIGTVGRISLLQQKVFSRLPLIAGLLVFAFFPAWADHLLTLSIVLSAAFLSISVGKARHQRRLFFKMGIFLLLYLALASTKDYWLFVFGDALLLLALYYFFLFEESLAVRAMLEEFTFNEGKSA